MFQLNCTGTPTTIRVPNVLNPEKKKARKLKREKNNNNKRNIVTFYAKRREEKDGEKEREIVKARM